jgi:hypothetical protein
MRAGWYCEKKYTSRSGMLREGRGGGRGYHNAAGDWDEDADDGVRDRPVGDGGHGSTPAGDNDNCGRVTASTLRFARHDPKDLKSFAGFLSR